MLSDSARLAMRRAIFDEEESAGQFSGLPSRAAPTMVLVEDRLAPIAEIIEHLGDPGGGKRRPSAWLQQNAYRGESRTASGLEILQGRRCCMMLARGIEQQLGHLRLPFRRTCPACGATWAVEMRVRDDLKHRGRHGR